MNWLLIAYNANNMGQDQTSPLGAVLPGLILFAPLINLYDSNCIYIPLGTALSGPAWFAHLAYIAKNMGQDQSAPLGAA